MLCSIVLCCVVLCCPVSCCAVLCSTVQCCADAVAYHAISKCEWLDLEEEPNIIEEIVTITNLNMLAGGLR